MHHPDPSGAQPSGCFSQAIEGGCEKLWYLTCRHSRAWIDCRCTPPLPVCRSLWAQQRGAIHVREELCWVSFWRSAVRLVPALCPFRSAGAQLSLSFSAEQCCGKLQSAVSTLVCGQVLRDDVAAGRGRPPPGQPHAHHRRPPVPHRLWIHPGWVGLITSFGSARHGWVVVHPCKLPPPYHGAQPLPACLQAATPSPSRRP